MNKYAAVMWRVYTMIEGRKIQVGLNQPSERKAREIVKRHERGGRYCFIEKIDK